MNGRQGELCKVQVTAGNGGLRDRRRGKSARTKKLWKCRTDPLYLCGLRWKFLGRSRGGGAGGG